MDVSASSESTDSAHLLSARQVVDRNRQQSKVASAHRSKSPRPKTLPGLTKSCSESQAIPGLVQLAGSALLNSPQAPLQVKAFAKTLVEGLITDTMAGEREHIEEVNN